MLPLPGLSYMKHKIKSILRENELMRLPESGLGRGAWDGQWKVHAMKGDPGFHLALQKKVKTRGQVNKSVRRPQLTNTGALHSQ